MRNYTAHFFTSADWAIRRIKARSPAHALQLAHELYDEHTEVLDFQSYDTTDGLDSIEIWDAGRKNVASWQSDAYLLRQAADVLLEALERAVAALNTAPCFRVPHLDTNSYEIAALCGRAIAKAKGGAA